MVAVQNVLDAARADETVAGVADNLEPGLQVVGKRAHAAAQVAGSSAAADAVKRVAGIEFHQEAVINAGQRPFPARAYAGTAHWIGCRLRRFRLRSRGRRSWVWSRWRSCDGCGGAKRERSCCGPIRRRTPVASGSL